MQTADALPAGPVSRSSAEQETAGRPVWLVLADPLPTRIFLDCGIARRLAERLGSRLIPVFLEHVRHEYDRWVDELGGRAVVQADELMPADVPALERVRRRADGWLDKRIGHYPLAIRFNYRHGFHLDRMRPHHPYALLDSARIGSLPRWRSVERLMRAFVWSPHRHVPQALLERLEAERPVVVLSTIQLAKTAPFLVAARRLHLPLVGYVESWDQTVGKSAIAPYFDRYVVQNQAMREDLARLHHVDRDKVVVTGWPQSDVFNVERPRSAYEAILREYRLDPGRPTIVVMGNTPANAPYEHRFVRRLVDWKLATRDSPQLLFRPHPADRYEWRERFAAAADVAGVAVQQPSYTDLELLATLLRHADCVVANAGTILLDAIVNDRPAVCVLYDEGAPSGTSHAQKNVAGEHYRDVIDSQAFHRAESFDEVVAGIERSLAFPAELAAERQRVTQRVVGQVDGHAADRVADAIMEVAG